MSILVSVIIPTHKRKFNYVKRAVDSVLNQTYTNWEIVIVDDNSEFPEYRVSVENYISSLNSKKVRLVKNDKWLGGSLTRNRGVKEARGEYIAFLDDDDEFRPYRIEESLDFMIKNNSDMVFTNRFMYNSKGKIVDFRDHREIESFDKDYLLRYHLTKQISGTSTFMYRKEAFEKIGGFEDVKMGQEYIIMIRTICGGLKIDYLDSNSTILYKPSDGGISQGRNKIIGEKNLYATKKTYFDILSKDEIKYIKFRHYAVMVVAYSRNRNPIAMVGMGIMAFVSSPVDFVKEVWGFFYRVFQKRKTISEGLEDGSKETETVTK